MSIVPVIPARPMADSYLGLDFSPVSAAILTAAYADMLVYITRRDGGTYDQSNDYSYNASDSASWSPTTSPSTMRGSLIYGAEP